MNVEMTIAPCASGAWHADSPARLRTCIRVAGAECCADCLRRVAGLLDGNDGGFHLIAPEPGERDDTGEMMSNLGMEEQ